MNSPKDATLHVNAELIERTEAAGRRRGGVTPTEELRRLGEALNARWDAHVPGGHAVPPEFRLETARLMARAKHLSAGHLGFRRWVEENLSYAYETARKLARVGEDADPQAKLTAERRRIATIMRASRESG